MRLRRVLAFGVAVFAPALVMSSLWAQSSSGEAAESGEDEVVFSEAYLEDPEVLAAGREVWDGTCQHCHGRSAYPGKAPILRPGRYEADFVYDRVTYGFRKMPAWEDVLAQDERMSVAAYVASKRFSP
jgi:mono/diheme cytochrome c family protein